MNGYVMRRLDFKLSLQDAHICAIKKLPKEILAKSERQKVSNYYKGEVRVVLYILRYKGETLPREL